MNQVLSRFAQVQLTFKSCCAARSAHTPYFEIPDPLMQLTPLFWYKNSTHACVSKKFLKSASTLLTELRGRAIFSVLAHLQLEAP